MDSCVLFCFVLFFRTDIFFHELLEDTSYTQISKLISTKISLDLNPIFHKFFNVASSSVCHREDLVNARWTGVKMLLGMPTTHMQCLALPQSPLHVDVQPGRLQAMESTWVKPWLLHAFGE